ncbi:uncharacterized protein ACJ7VT_013038 [Polymixia lowei]
MSTLSSKSAQEISELLDDYGIKHGPVVDSTRSLYEKKLREAMAKEKMTKPSPDKTYYREEAEEVTYVSYRTPMRNEASGDRRPYMRSRPEYSEREFEDERPYSRPRPEYSGRDFVDEPYIYDTPSTYRDVSYSKPTPMKSGGDAPEEAKSSRLIPLWVQFLVFLVVAAFLYLVFSNMESPPNDPFKKIE